MSDPLEWADYATRLDIGQSIAAEWFMQGGRDLDDGELVVMVEHIASWLWDDGYQIVPRKLGDKS